MRKARVFLFSIFLISMGISLMSCVSKNVSKDALKESIDNRQKKQMVINEERVVYVSRKMIYAPSKTYFIESKNKGFQRLDFIFSTEVNQKKKGEEVSYISKVPYDFYRSEVFTKPFYVFFKFDSYKIQKREREKLKKLAALINKYPIDEIILEGYADDIGSEKYNKTLSYLRAKSVKSYLKKYLLKDKVKFVLVPKGEVYSKDRNKSRRVTIKIETLN